MLREKKNVLGKTLMCTHTHSQHIYQKAIKVYIYMVVRRTIVIFNYRFYDRLPYIFTHIREK